MTLIPALGRNTSWEKSALHQSLLIVMHIPTSKTIIILKVSTLIQKFRLFWNSRQSLNCETLCDRNTSYILPTYDDKQNTFPFQREDQESSKELSDQSKGEVHESKHESLYLHIQYLGILMVLSGLQSSWVDLTLEFCKPPALVASLCGWLYSPYDTFLLQIFNSSRNFKILGPLL